MTAAQYLNCLQGVMQREWLRFFQQRSRFLSALGRGIEVDDLPGGMNAGVGTPTGVNMHRCTGHFGQRILDGLLNGGRVLEPLKAAKARAIVLDAHRQAAR